MNSKNTSLAFLVKWWLICGWLFLAFTQAFGQNNSIVKITADQATGYGIAWGGPNTVVTTLQLVAGKSHIEIDWRGYRSNALIEKVYKPSGLALLKLTQPINIPQIHLISGHNPIGEKVNYYETNPNRTTVMVKKNSELIDETKLERINTRIYQDADLLLSSLCFDETTNYPFLTTDVLRLEEPNIRKEHTGSAVTYKGKLIGMIDCSPKRLNGNTCFWVISAEDFNKLIKQESRIPFPIKSCLEQNDPKQDPLPSPPSDSDPGEPEELQVIEYKDPNGDRLTLEFERTIQFTEIYETLFSKDIDYVDSLAYTDTTFNDLRPSLIYELLNQSIDFYKEITTGISIALPSQTALVISKDGFGNLVTAYSADRLSNFSIYISACKNLKKANKAYEEFMEMIESEGVQISESTIHSMDFMEDETHPYFSTYIQFDALGTDSTMTSRLTSRATISSENFLGVKVEATDWTSLTSREERIYYYLLLICARITDFPIH